MKRIAVGWVSVPLDERDRWVDTARRFCDNPSWFEPFGERGRPSVHCRFDKADPRYEQFLALLRAHGLVWTERIEHEYTAAELHGAPLLEMSLERAPRDTGDFLYTEQFDFSTMCPKCGTGAVPVGPLVVRESALRGTGLIYRSMRFEYLVAEPVARALRAAQCSGLELLPVRSHKGATLSWWQIVPRYEMPPWSSQTRGTKRGTSRGEICWDAPCEACGRDGYFSDGKQPTQLVYCRSDLRDWPLPDFAQTYERFGCSVLREPFAKSQFAQGLLLVSPRVYDILQGFKIDGLRFEPVRIS